MAYPVPSSDPAGLRESVRAGPYLSRCGIIRELSEAGHLCIWMAIRFCS